MIKQNDRFEKNEALNEDILKADAPKKRKPLALKYKVLIFVTLFILGLLCIIGIVFLGVNLTTPIPH